VLNIPVNKIYRVCQNKVEKSKARLLGLCLVFLDEMSEDQWAISFCTRNFKFLVDQNFIMKLQTQSSFTLELLSTLFWYTQYLVDIEA